MGHREKLVIKILSGVQDNNIKFDELCNLLEYMGFSLRIKGSHHIFYKENVEEILNIQPKDANAKAYQVKQVRNIIVKYGLGGDIDA